MDPLPIDLDAVTAARARIARADKLLATIQHAGGELAALLADDRPIIRLGAGAPAASQDAAPDTPTPPDPTPDAETPAPAAAPETPPPDAPNPPRTGGGGRGSNNPRRGETVKDRIHGILRELGGCATVQRVADELGVTASAVNQAARKGIPGIRRIAGQSNPHTDPLLELEGFDPDDTVDTDALERAGVPAPLAEATRAVLDQADTPEDGAERLTRNGDEPDHTPDEPDVPAGMSIMDARIMDNRRRPAPAMSARTRRAVEAELDRPDTPPAVPILEQKLKAELAERGPNTIRGLFKRLRPTDRAALADTVMRLVATGDLVNAGRETPGGDVLYRLA